MYQKLYEAMLNILLENSIFGAMQDCFVPFQAIQKFHKP